MEYTREYDKGLEVCELGDIGREVLKTSTTTLVQEVATYRKLSHLENISNSFWNLKKMSPNVSLSCQIILTSQCKPLHAEGIQFMSIQLPQKQATRKVESKSLN